MIIKINIGDTTSDQITKTLSSNLIIWFTVLHVYVEIPLLMKHGYKTPLYDIPGCHQ